jgi:hypothetical protein
VGAFDYTTGSVPERLVRAAARVRAVADEVAREADAARREAEALHATLRAPASAADAPAIAPGQPAALGPTPVSFPTAAPGPGAAPSPPPGAQLDAARLVAIELADAGRARAEVERHLRAAFPLAPPEPILDDVFGPSAPAHGGR